jgi:hypothetical protein
VRLIHRQEIDPELGEVDDPVPPRRLDQGLQTVFERLEQLLHAFHASAFASLIRFGEADRGFKVLNLLTQECLQFLGRQVDEPEGGMRDDHRVPGTGRDPGEELLTPIASEVLFAGHQHLGPRIQLLKRVRPLQQQMIRHDDERSLHQV